MGCSEEHFWMWRFLPLSFQLQQVGTLDIIWFGFLTTAKSTHYIPSAHPPNMHGRKN